MTDQIGRNPLKSHVSSIRSNGGFIAYSDASWGPGVDYPMYGYVIYLFGGVVSYTSKQLKVVCFSSCEAEYAAIGCARVVNDEPELWWWVGRAAWSSGQYTCEN